MADRFVLFFFMSILVAAKIATNSAALSELDKYDIEEIVEKLLEFDMNGDGQLDEMEIELQPGVQRYIDKYHQLLKLAESEDEEEEEENPAAKPEVEEPKKRQSTEQRGKATNEAETKEKPQSQTKTQTKTSKNIKQVKGTEQKEKSDRAQASDSEKPQTGQSGKAANKAESKGKPPSHTKTQTKSSKGAGQQDKKAHHNQKLDRSQPPTPLSASSSQAQEDEDDGVVIEVVDEMEYVEDDGNDAVLGGRWLKPALAAGVVGILTAVVYALRTVTRQTAQVKRQQEEELIKKREAWLDRVSGNQQQKDPSVKDKKIIPSRDEEALSQSLARSSPKSAKNHSAMVSPSSEESCQSKDRTDSPKENDHLKRQSSVPLRELRNYSSLQAARGDCQINSTGTPIPKPEKLAKVNLVGTSGDGKKTDRSPPQSPDSSKVAPAAVKPRPPPPEKTSDLEKVKGFIEKAFSCTLMLVDDVSRMRFTKGEMRIPPSQFPSSSEDLEAKLKTLVCQAFDKQINKVKFSVNAYNICTAESNAFNDKMVDTSAVVIQREAVNTILIHFEEENQNNRSGDELWGSDDDGIGMGMYETYSFLPRLVDNSEDHVNVSSDLLSHLLSHEKSVCLVSNLLQAGGFRFSSSKRLDEVLLFEGAVLKALDVLVSNPHFGDALAKILAKETEMAQKESLALFFERKSVLALLLSISTIPHSPTGQQNFQLKAAAVEPFRSLRSYPNLTSDDISTAQTRIQQGINELQDKVYKGLRRVVTNKTTREAGLSWLATLLNLNEQRTSSVTQDNSGTLPVCSDGFMINLCSVLLEFFLPISQNLDKLEKVDISYSASPSCRLNYEFEPCLAYGRIEKGKEWSAGSPSLPQHTFITECFHLTQRALGITFIPAIKHFNKMESSFSSQIAHVAGTDKEETVKKQHILVSVVWETCLIDTNLARNVTTFYISQARLLLNAIKNIAEMKKDAEEVRQAQKEALAVVPEFCIKDMAQWFSFLATTVLRVHPNAAKGITLTPFVDCCVMLLERPDLMPGPVPASMIVAALLTFMKDSDKDTRFRGHSGWGSGIMSDLAAMVHTCPSVQTKLGPALLRTYVSVDVVEGLDVDKDSFDKFNSRVQIGQLVQKLWSRSDCRTSIIDQCGTELFQNFLNSILDTLLYMFHDSLARLANVKKVETLRANEDAWNALSLRERAEKDRFLRNEEHVGSGFMRQAKKSLEFLTLISQSDQVAQCFTRQPLATRAASTINGFLDSLCGAKSKNLKVKDMAKYQFNPVELLHTIINIILRITELDTSRSDGYLVSMVKDPDFELAHVEKAQSVIVSKGVAGGSTIDQVAQLLEQLKLLAAEHSPQQLLDSDEAEENWRDAFLELEINEKELEKQYVAVMQDQRFNIVSRIQDPHCFQSNMQGGMDARSSKVKVLMKEMKQLTTSLPVNANASVFVRQDKDRLDVMRALVTGPTGTPYSLGCFCFDIYFPASYPNVPPLVKIITTGNGTVRFNPNLYADGKVCLSLLGTWHAGDASEKWTPGKSSIYQVLVSIQSMILTADPVFNEPGYEAIKDTDEGEIQSRQYNWKLHLQTLRHAILGQLRNPPTGFERVVRHHLALHREAILKQCAEWVNGCEDPDIVRRLRQVADAIFEELMCLEVDFDEKDPDSDDEDEEDKED